MRPCHRRVRETVLITAERDGYIGWFDDVENTHAAIRRQIRTIQSPKPRRARTLFTVLQFLRIQSSGYSQGGYSLSLHSQRGTRVVSGTDTSLIEPPIAIRATHHRLTASQRGAVLP